MAKHILMNRTIIGLLVIIGVLQGMLYLDGSYSFMLSPARTAVRLIMFAAIAYLAVSILLTFTMDRVGNFFGEDAEQRIFFSKMYSFLIFLIATIVVLYKLGLSLDNITIIIGFIATGIAFAIRDIIMSLFAWFILLTKRPFRIGDFIQVGEDQGKVMHIGTFFVLIDDTPDNQDDYTRIPTRIFLEKPVHNFGKSDILDKVSFPLKKIPGDIEKRIVRIRKSLAQYRPIVSLEASESSYNIIVSYRVTYTERKKAGTLILAELSEENSDAARDFS